MKQFKRIRFYCGIGFQADGSPVDPAAVAKVREHLSAGFGGFTEFAGTGAWRDENRHLITEPCLVFEVLADPEDTSADFIEFTAVSVRTILAQSAVLLTVEPGIFGEFV